MKSERDKKLNTPKTQQIDTLFREALGIEKVSNHWKWPKKMTVARATKKLDEMVTLRGAIAHRGSPSSSVTKAKVVDYFKFIKKVTALTGGEVNRHVKTTTGKALW
jgi:RiboL-PSP-HEPN